jgi:flagellar hook-basal body protein
MLKSLFDGISGLKGHQIRMDVVGNNISNVNTNGYKANRANFQDTLSNVISMNTQPGGLQSTGRTLDLAISGDGFFKVVNPENGEVYYTREGMFSIDPSGYLVNADGYRLVGDLRNITTATASISNGRVTAGNLTGVNDISAFITGIKEFGLITAADTQNSTETISLQGTMSDGTAGAAYDFTVETAQRAVISTSETYNLDPDTTTLSELNLNNGDVVEFSVSNAYTGNTETYRFKVINANTQTIGDLQKAISENLGENLEMYYTQGGQEVDGSSLDGTSTAGFAIRTQDYGPGINLKVSTWDDLENPKDFVLNTSDNGVSGQGDDINSIIQKINAKTDDTGVQAAKSDNNKLVLSTVGKGENSLLRVNGRAATLLGLPVSGTVDVPASTKGTTDFARINPGDTLKDSSNLILRGTLEDGTLGSSQEFNIETAQRAEVNVGNNYSIRAGGLTTLSDLGFTGNEKLTFAYKNKYTGQEETFEINIGSSQQTKTLSWLQEQFAEKAAEKGLGNQVEMCYTDDGKIVEPGFLDYDGDEGITFRTIDYGPGVSFSVVTEDVSNGSVKDNLFNGIESGNGEDINDLIEKINKFKDVTGVIASNVDDQLVLKTLGEGESANLQVSGDAAQLLGFPVSATNNSAATVSGTEDRARLTPAETKKDSLTLTLQGTLPNGGLGEKEDITIKTAEVADVTAGNYNISVDGSTKLSDIVTVNPGDSIKVTFTNPYTGVENATMELDINGGMTVKELRDSFNSTAKSNDIDLEMYYTTDKIAFKTTDYGKGIKFSINTENSGAPASVFSGIPINWEDTTSMTLDDIVNTINEKKETTGVIATKVDNTLVLTTAGTGEDAILNISGDAAHFLGVPVTTGTQASTYGESYARITAKETPNEKETLTLKGTTKPDGTAGISRDIEITKATAADINAGENYTIDSGANTQLNTIFADGDKLEFTVTNEYGTNQTFTITIGAGQDLELTDTLADLQSEIESHDVEMYFTKAGQEVTDLSTLAGDGDEGFGFRTTDYGPGASLAMCTRDNADDLKNIFTGNSSELANIEANGTYIEKGAGDDIDTIIDKINNVTSDTGIMASKFDDQLVLETVIAGANQSINISGGAAGLLGLLPGNHNSSSNTKTEATATAATEYKRDIDANLSLSLQGTTADGNLGISKDIEIQKATAADINAGENYTIASNANTQLDTIFADGDKLEFTVTNEYGTNETFTITIGAGQDLELNQTLADLQSEIENHNVEMYFTKAGQEVTDLTTLAGDGDEGFGFRTTDKGPGVSLAICTRDAGNNLSNIFDRDNSELAAIEANGPYIERGAGDDIDTIIDKINAEKDTTGIVAGKINDKLVLKTLGEGEDATLTVNVIGDDSDVEKLGLSSITYQGTTDYKAYTGNSDFTGTFENNTQPSGVFNGTSATTATLSLQGTRLDGKQGDTVDFEIEAAREAYVNAGENYSIKSNTTMGDLGFSDGDKVEFTITNPYDQNQSKTIAVNVFGTQTIKDFRNNLYQKLATENISPVDDPAIEMYFTQGGLEDDFADLDGSGDEGFGFRTADYGPEITLSISVKDKNDNIKQALNGSQSDFSNGIAKKTGSGDDVDSIVRKINDQSDITGVVASKDSEGKLVLKTQDISQGAEMQVSGPAAKYLGLTSKVYKNSDEEMPATLKLSNPIVSNVNISSDGVISGTDGEGIPFRWEYGSNNADVAQITLATFANANGLKKASENLFQPTESSGEAKEGDPGNSGYGNIESGSLEGSNVDLTDEFGTIITTQRGYQANARVVTVTDTMLEELLNLKR